MRKPESIPSRIISKKKGVCGHYYELVLFEASDQSNLAREMNMVYRNILMISSEKENIFL